MWYCVSKPMTSFGEWIVQTCEGRGWNTAELARRAGMNQSVLSRIINGGRNPGERTCTAIANALGIPAEEVFRRAGLLRSSNDDSVEVARIVHGISQLPPEDVQFIEQWIRLRVEWRAQSKKGKARETKTKEESGA